MEMRSFVMAILVFSGFMAGMSGFILDVGTSSGQTVSDLSTLSQANDINLATKALEQTFETKITGIALIDAPLVSVVGFIQFIDLIGKYLFGWWFTMFNYIFFYLNVPPFFIMIVGTAIMWIIIMEMISAIIRWRT